MGEAVKYRRKWKGRCQSIAWPELSVHGWSRIRVEEVVTPKLLGGGIFWRNGP